MFKALYWGNPHTVLSTLLLGANIGYLLWACARKAHIQKWGMSILLLILLHGLFWYFANIRDGYSNSIVHAIDGSTEMGLFSANSVQSIVFWLGQYRDLADGHPRYFQATSSEPRLFYHGGLQRLFNGLY